DSQGITSRHQVEPASRAAMSHRGRSRHDRQFQVELRDDAARKAQRLADELACVAWNERMARLGGPAEPSPSLRAAVNGGFPWLRVECNGCQQRAWIDLRKLRRAPETPICGLEGALRCSLCRRGRSFSRAKVQMLCQFDKQT